MTACRRGFPALQVMLASLTGVAGKGCNRLCVVAKGHDVHATNAAHCRVTEKKPRRLPLLPFRVRILFAQSTRNALVLPCPASSSLDQIFAAT